MFSASSLSIRCCWIRQTQCQVIREFLAGFCNISAFQLHSSLKPVAIDTKSTLCPFGTSKTQHSDQTDCITSKEWVAKHGLFPESAKISKCSWYSTGTERSTLSGRPLWSLCPDLPVTSVIRTGPALGRLCASGSGWPLGLLLLLAVLTAGQLALESRGWSWLACRVV